jgi:signal transduction histidine kinase
MVSAGYAESSLELNRHIVNLLDSLSALHGLTEISLSGIDETQLLKAALEALMSNQDMERCSIFLLNDDGTLTNGAGMDWDDMLRDIVDPAAPDSPRPPSGKIYRKDEGIMGRAAASGQVEHCRSCADDPQFKQFGAADKAVQGSLICVPLTCEHQVLGVLNVSYPLPDFFNLWHERLLLLFCKMLGRLLVNHRFMHHLGALVDQRTAALREINETLESRVREQVAKNLETERMLMQQARLAAMGEMIGNIAHQWRQPINALGLVLANIQDAWEYGELDKHYLDETVGKGKHLIQNMSVTIDDFRNFFKPNKLKQGFSLRQAVESSLNLVSHSFKNNHVTIDMAQGGDFLANGFPNEFSQALLNILNNARDVLLERKIPRGRISIRLGRRDDKVFVALRDNAGGIAAEILPKIFDPYFTTRENGTGIGLYMSRMVMENMNGTLAACNAEEGAEFTLALPTFSPAISSASLASAPGARCLPASVRRRGLPDR